MDGDGAISKADLAMGIRALGKNPTEKELKEALKSVGAFPFVTTGSDLVADIRCADLRRLSPL